MPLYAKYPMNALELKTKVRQEFERAVLSNEPEGILTTNLIALGPRVITYADGRSITQQMAGLSGQFARLQMAYTYLAVGSVLRSLSTGKEA